MSLLRSSARGIGYPLAALLAVASLPVVGPVLIAANYRDLADRLSRVPGIERGGGAVSGLVAAGYVVLAVGSVGTVATTGGPLAGSANESNVPATVSPTATDSPSVIDSPTETATQVTGKPAETLAATPTPTAIPTPTATPTPSPAPTPTATPSPTMTPTATLTPTPTAAPTPTPTATPTPTRIRNHSERPENFTELFITDLAVNQGGMFTEVKIRGVEVRNDTLYVVHNATDGNQNATQRAHEQYSILLSYSATINTNNIDGLSLHNPRKMKYIEQNSTNLSHQPRTATVKRETALRYLEDGNDFEWSEWRDRWIENIQIASKEEAALANNIDQRNENFTADGSVPAPSPDRWDDN